MAFNYVPTETGLKFHNSTKFLKLLLGPYGSGKSCMSAMEILFNAIAQAPASDGVRYSRIGVCRSSYPELQSATRRSLMEVLPSECGTISSTGSPMRGLYNIPLPDGTRVQLELELWAILSEDDNEKIKSSNWTACWINEATGCSPTLVPAVMSRIGRYPSPAMGGVTWSGVLMDSNQPVPGSWLDDFIQHPKDNWDIFIQPPAAFKKELDDGTTIYEINPLAENLCNLGAYEAGDSPDFTCQDKGMRYYRNQIETLVELGRFDIIHNQYCLLREAIIDGKPVYPTFNKKRHVAAQELKPKPFNNIVIGFDTSGLHPAAVVMQEQNNRWCLLDELYADNEPLEIFINSMLVPLLRTKYSSNPVIAALDPSSPRDAWQGFTPKERLAEVGITATTEISNTPKVRIQAVTQMLNTYDGGLFISPNCELTIRGFESEYRYRRVRAAGTMGAVYTEQPEKNDASHLADACQYACLFIQKGLPQNDDKSKRIANILAEQRRRLARVV